MNPDDLFGVIIFGTFVVLMALMRWSLARADGFTFWSNRPKIGWDAYNARRDAAVAAHNAEEENADACLEALTPMDVEILTGLGWEPPAAVAERAQVERRRELAADGEARLAAGETLPQSALAAIADARIAANPPVVMRSIVSRLAGPMERPEVVVPVATVSKEAAYEAAIADNMQKLAAIGISTRDLCAPSLGPIRPGRPPATTPYRIDHRGGPISRISSSPEGFCWGTTVIDGVDHYVYRRPDGEVIAVPR